MSLLVRKIEKAKWMQNDIVGGADVSADAITNCIKTKGNTLSTWEISEESDIADAVLAIVSAREYLDTIDIVCLKRSSLESQGLVLQSTPGNTQVKDLINQHIDISDLTYRSLGTVAEQIVQEIKGGKVRRYTKGMIKKLLNDAIDLGRVQKADLHERLRNKL
jgi:hypothetical protein